MSTKYVNVDKACEMFERYFTDMPDENTRAVVLSMKESFLSLPTVESPRATAHKILPTGYRHFCTNCSTLTYCENFCSGCGAEVVGE